MVKYPAESDAEKLFVPFILTVAPGSIMPCLPVILPLITGWQNTVSLMKKRNHRKKRIDLSDLRKVVILLIKHFSNIRYEKGSIFPGYSFPQNIPILSLIIIFQKMWPVQLNVRVAYIKISRFGHC
jgi:hypothetical protein